MRNPIGLAIALVILAATGQGAKAENAVEKKLHALKDAEKKKEAELKAAAAKTKAEAKAAEEKAAAALKKAGAAALQGGEKESDLLVVDAKAFKDYLLHKGKQVGQNKPVAPQNYRELLADNGKSQGLFAGAAPGKWEMQYLKNNGVKTIVSLQPSDETTDAGGEEALAKAAGLAFRRLVYDPHKSLATGDAEKVVAALAQGAHQPTYVHCLFGKDRTGGMVALHRVINQKWAPAKAFHEWRDRNGYCALGAGQFDKTFSDMMAALKAKTGDAKYDFRIAEKREECMRQ
jgi:protein tyrosine phosphatase (PTP) superfamily phosphohydrolase (DUF442 family)